MAMLDGQRRFANSSSSNPRLHQSSTQKLV
jgi:hypothetical protein